MTGPRFLYLHGFASSKASTKARAFAAWAERHGASMDVLDLRVPTFETLSFSAITSTITRAIDDAGGPSARVALVGSSLGGLAASRVAAADARVCAIFLMAPAFALASRWRERLGHAAFETWRNDGSLEVDDFRTGRRARVHFAFVAELERIDERLGRFPDVRVPVRIVHGVRDDVVDIELSRTWAEDKGHVKLVEVDDGHELTSSVERVLDEASDFFRAFYSTR
jgi:uncharacterized protein